MNLWYFNNTDIFIVAFSINDKNSYQNVSSKWICLIEKYTDRRKIFMLGLKCDPRTEGSDCVTFDEAVKKADRNKCLGYHECSIVDNAGKYQRFIGSCLNADMTDDQDDQDFYDFLDIFDILEVYRGDRMGQIFNIAVDIADTADVAYIC